MTDPAASPVAEPRCPNCAAPAPRRFCAECGQRQDRRLASVRRMAMEAIHDQFSLGTELPRTLGALLFAPGRLTTDYLAGRVARYVTPLRLYVVSSLVFFLLLSWTSGIDEAVAVSDEFDAAADSVAAEVASTERRVVRRGPVTIQVDGENDGEIDVRFDTLKVDRLTPVRRWAQRRIGRINAMEEGEFRRRLLEGLQANLHTAVFFLLPIYALLLKLVYIRSRRLYAEHFIYALHVHAFAFLLFTAALFLPGLIDTLLLAVALPVYLLVAMRRVYPQPWWKTALKYGFLFVAYSAALGAVLGATALVTALTV